jgi:hypothetical protein
MKKVICHSIIQCIQAINNSGIGSDQEVLQTIGNLANLQYTGRGLGIGTEGYKGYRFSSEDFLKHNLSRKTIEGVLNWETTLLFLYDFANYSESEILYSAEAIKDAIIFNHVLQHIISNSVNKNEIDNALQFIPNFRTTHIFQESNNRDKGYLIILRHYASAGDAENFFKYFKLAEPGKNRFEINGLKSYLVESFAAKNGIQEAIKLCTHKNLGEKYHSNALYAFAKTGQYIQLKAIFEKYPNLKQPEIESEISLLSIAYLVARQQKKDIPDDFSSLFESALKIDRKIKFGDSKLQDAVLLNLGLAEQDDKERLTKCRKAIKNSSIKRELDARPD